jgi:hypothetical protein
VARLDASPPASPAPRFAAPAFPLFPALSFGCYSAKRSFAGQAGRLSDNHLSDGFSDIKIGGRNNGQRKPMNASKHVSKPTWSDPDDAPELTDAGFA